MRRWTTLPLALVTSSILLLGCGSDPDSTTTGDADPGADSQTEGNRDTTECIDDDAQTGETIEESGEDPMGSTESDTSCATGNGDQSGGDGDVDSGGDPGTGTPSDGSSGSSGGSDTGTGGAGG